jgi:hypothetical protein
MGGEIGGFMPAAFALGHGRARLESIFLKALWHGAFMARQHLQPPDGSHPENHLAAAFDRGANPLVPTQWPFSGGSAMRARPAAEHR